MSLDSKQTEDRPISRVDELAEYFTSAERKTPGLVGLEHEKFVFPAKGATPVAYAGPSGIGALLEGFRAQATRSTARRPSCRSSR